MGTVLQWKSDAFACKHKPSAGLWLWKPQDSLFVPSRLVRLRLAHVLWLVISSLFFLPQGQKSCLKGQIFFPQIFLSDSTSLPLLFVDDFLENIYMAMSFPCMYVDASCMYSYHRDQKKALNSLEL